MPSTLRKVKLSDTVASELLLLIRNGTYPSGTRLPAERELSAHFGVSRASLRDAFRQLELLGQVEIRQGDGTYVRSPDAATLSLPFRGLLSGSPQAALDLLEFRLLLEPEVAALAAQRATAQHVPAFERALAQQREAAARGLRLSREDLLFHQLVAQTAGNPVILEVLALLRSLLSDLRTTALSGHLPDLTVAQHERIAQAILSNDPPQARAAMLEHLTAVVETSALKPTAQVRSSSPAGEVTL